MSINITGKKIDFSNFGASQNLGPCDIELVALAQARPCKERTWKHCLLKVWFQYNFISNIVFYWKRIITSQKYIFKNSWLKEVIKRSLYQHVSLIWPSRCHSKRSMTMIIYMNSYILSNSKIYVKSTQLYTCLLSIYVNHEVTHN